MTLNEALPPLVERFESNPRSRYVIDSNSSLFAMPEVITERIATNETYCELPTSSSEQGQSVGIWSALASKLLDARALFLSDVQESAGAFDAPAPSKFVIFETNASDSPSDVRWLLQSRYLLAEPISADLKQKLDYVLGELDLIDDDAEELDFPKPSREIKDETKRISRELYLRHSVNLDGDVCVMDDGSICIFFYGPFDSIVSIYCNQEKSYCYSNIKEKPNRGEFLDMVDLPDEFTMEELRKLERIHNQ